MNGDLFWALMLFISGCVIIHLYRKVQRLSDAINESVIDKFVNKWDEEYRQIVEHYGSGEAFEEAHTQDYNIFRSNVLIFVDRIKNIREGINMSIKYLSKELETGKSKATMLIKLEAVRGSIESAMTRLVDDTVAFLKNEEQAHLGKEYIDEILDSLSKEVKNNNFYDKEEN